MLFFGGGKGLTLFATAEKCREPVRSDMGRGTGFSGV